MENINNLELVNYKLEADILKLEKEINSLIDTRKILKRNKMDCSTIQGLIEQLTSTKINMKIIYMHKMHYLTMIW